MKSSAATDPDTTPLIAHIVHRFDYGGLENGLVNIINTMDEATYRHAVIALTEVTDFARRITRGNTSLHSLNKLPGKDPGVYYRLWSLLRELRPAVVHTRNIGTMDCVAVGRLAGVSTCIHGEHGWDTHDPDGNRAKYRCMRRLLNPLVTAFITVSLDLGRWLVDVIGIAPGKVTTICNGVDTKRFRPADAPEHGVLPAALAGERVIIVGTVTRFEAIKDPLNLIQAYIAARGAVSDAGIDLRLVMLGDGALKAEAEEMIESAGLADYCWLPGMRDDVAELIRCFDVFALSSRREGISNTILEALASGLPVIATRTGGNPELVSDGVTGLLVDPENPTQLGNAIEHYARSREHRLAHGRAARQRAETHYSLAAMAESYRQVYAAALAKSGI